MTATQPSWFLDERAYAGEENLDPDHVARYDAKAGNDPGSDVELLIRLGLSPASTVVDLGAGTGATTLELAPHCARVVAVDISPAMLALLRQRVSAAGVTNVDVVEGGFLSYEHRGDPADFVYCRNALHHLPDFWKVVALERIAQMLRPGGILRLRDLVYSFGPSAVDEYIERWMTSATHDITSGWIREELETHVRDEYSTFTWLLEPMIERAGFAIEETHYSDDGLFARYVCVKSG